MKFHLSKIVLVVLFLGSGAPLRAQGTEVEPNHPCSSAQDFGPISPPFMVSGSLDPPPGEGDVDFYRFEAIPSSPVRVDLEGQATGQGTLSDPFLGFFDSGCSLIEISDNSDTSNSRLFITIPDDGILVLAATSCCDHQFQGNPGVSGSYRLSISQETFAGSISGRVIDAVSGEPLPGQGFPFTHLRLFRCSGGDCSEFVGSQGADLGGQFRFDSGNLGRELLAGTYQLRITADTYVETVTTAFDVGEGEDLDLGGVALPPIPRIGGVSGRIVDAVSGFPLAGDTSPFTEVELRFCEPFFCFRVNSQNTDGEGRFRFERDFAGRPLLVGNYEVRISAQEYEPGETDPFAVGENELVDLGDIALAPFPIGISQVSPCGNLPRDGGLCLFNLRLTNRSGGPLDGAAWNVVSADGIGTLADVTSFQIAPMRRMTLAAGESRRLIFGLEVPGSVQSGANICVELFFGTDRERPFFNTVAHRDLFCIQKQFSGALKVLSDKESQRAIQEMKKGRPPLIKEK